MIGECPKWISKAVCIGWAYTFGIYLLDDYLRHLLSFIYEGVIPFATVMPACVILLLAAFLLE